MDKLVILNQMGKMLFNPLVILFLLWEVRPCKFLSAVLLIKENRSKMAGFLTEICDNKMRLNYPLAINADF
nr:hypothetical protein [Microcystis aeruginosa]